MTIPAASQTQLDAAAADPIKALEMASEMLAAIAHGHNFDSLDFMMRREVINKSARVAAGRW
jgi:hypothetical protein